MSNVLSIEFTVPPTQIVSKSVWLKNGHTVAGEDLGFIEGEGLTYVSWTEASSFMLEQGGP